ncbi:MAG: DUF1905 domain-containing protein [Pseudolysinimonas sp.]
MSPGSARYTFTAPLWQWKARRDEWFFVTVPEGISDEIAARSEGLTRGFNSVPVEVHVSETRWRTSIFPGGDGRYWLPLKKSVRVAEGIERDSTVNVTIELRLATP